MGDVLVPRGGTVAVFDSRGRHRSTKDSITGATLLTFGYDAEGRLVTVTDADGNVLRVERNASGQPAGILAPGGQRTTLTRDSHGYLDVAQSPGGAPWNFDFAPDGKGLLDRLTDPRGGLHEYQFDSLGLLARNDDPENGYNTLSRAGTPAAFSVTRRSALGRATTFDLGLDLESEDVSVRVINPDGTTRSRQGDEITTSSQGEDGTQSVRTRSKDPRFAMLDPLLGGSMTTPGGKTLSVSESRTATLSSPGDPFSLTALTATTTVSSRSTTATYSAATRTWTMTSPGGRQATAVVDARGRLSSSQVASLAATSVTYDARGRVSTITRGSGVDARTVTLGYDAGNELVSITDPLTRTTTFERDLDGRITRQVLPDLREVLAGYDLSGNVTSITPPGRPAHGFAYSLRDQQKTYMPPSVTPGGPTSYAYSADRELTTVTRPDAATITLAYGTTSGQLTSVTRTAGSLSFSYDVTTGRLLGLDESHGQNLDFTWDGFLPLSETWSGTIAGSVSRTFASDLRLATEQVNGANSVSFTFDADGLLTAAGAMSPS